MNRIIKHIPSFPLSPSDQEILFKAGLQLVHCDTPSRSVIIAYSDRKVTLSHTLRDSVAYAHHAYDFNARNICAVDDMITMQSLKKLKDMGLGISLDIDQALKKLSKAETFFE